MHPWLSVVLTLTLAACGTRATSVEEPMSQPVPADATTPEAEAVADPAGDADTVTLEALAQSPEAVTVHGAALPDFKTPGACVLGEVVLGERDEAGGWTAWQNLWSAGGELTLRRGDDVVRVPKRNLRLHLSPTSSEVFTDAASAPPPVAAWLAENGGPAEVAEYCLLEGKPYYLALAQESYSLPPREPDGAPERRTNTVAHLSDVPLVNGKPTGPLTPSSQSWTY